MGPLSHVLQGYRTNILPTRLVLQYRQHALEKPFLETLNIPSAVVFVFRRVPFPFGTSFAIPLRVSFVHCSIPRMPLGGYAVDLPPRTPRQNGILLNMIECHQDQLAEEKQQFPSSMLSFQCSTSRPVSARYRQLHSVSSVPITRRSAEYTCTRCHLLSDGLSSVFRGTWGWLPLMESTASLTVVMKFEESTSKIHGWGGQTSAQHYGPSTRQTGKGHLSITLRAAVHALPYPIMLSRVTLLGSPNGCTGSSSLFQGPLTSFTVSRSTDSPCSCLFLVLYPIPSSDPTRPTCHRAT